MRYLLLLLLLTGCTTPKTILKNPETGQLVDCGGNTTASWTGGAIGYHLQKNDDEDCIDAYKRHGFIPLETEGVPSEESFTEMKSSAHQYQKVNKNLDNGAQAYIQY